MRAVIYFTLAGLVIVGLSAMPPEHARWVALGLLVLVAVTPAVGRRVQPAAEDAGKPSKETELSDLR